MDKAVRNGIELIGPLALDHSWQAKEGLGYDRDSFHIDWDAQQARSPHGQLSHSWTRREHPGGDGAAIRFHTKDCQPVRHGLTARNPPSGAARSWSDPGLSTKSSSRTGWTGTIRTESAATTGEPGSKEPSPRVSGGFELRRCQYLGLTKTRVQHILTASAMNATRIADWHEHDNQHRTASSAGPLKTLCNDRPKPKGDWYLFEMI